MGNPNEKNIDAINLRNILILSVGFMLLMAAWLTTAGIELTILQSVKEDDPTFTGDGYLSQAIISIVFASVNFLAPLIISILGVRTGMVVGTILYSFFIGNFLYPRDWLLYTSSAVIGFGSGWVWVANGMYITQCSTAETMGKHMGIFWGIMASGQLIGNTFVYFKFQGMNHIDEDTRFLVVSILTVVSILASVTLMFLGAPPGQKKEGGIELELPKQKRSICYLLTQPFKLLANRHMLLLIPPSMYNGIELAFFTAIYPTSVGFSEAFGGDTRKLVGLAGIFAGVGSVVGGLGFGYLVDKISFIKSKRNFIVTCCCLGHCTCFILMYLNLSDSAPLHPTMDTSWLNPPSMPIAMVCAFLFGVGDGCISPQMAAAIGVIWSDDPSAALALYLFLKGASLGAGYYIGTFTGLYNQIIIFAVLTIVGTMTFRINEALVAKNKEYGLKDEKGRRMSAIVGMGQVNCTRKLSIATIPEEPKQ